MMRYKTKTKILTLILIILFPLPAAAGMLTIGVGGTNIHRRVVSVREAKYKNIVRQSVDFSCGAASLATLLRYYYGEEDVSERKVVGYLLETGDQEKIKQAGFSFLDLKRYATNINYRAGGYKLKDYQLLDKLKVPAIVLITTQGYQHFVVLKGIARGKVFIADPLRGNIALSKSEFYDAWNGVIFVVLATDKQKKTSDLALGAAITDAPKPQIVRLGELGINNYNNMGMKNLIIFPGEF